MVVLTSACLAEETLREIKWSDPNLRGKVAVGEVIEPNADCPFVQLKVQNTQDEKKTFSILTISDPCITSNRYALTGMVKYEHIQFPGYLEMWSYFPTGEMYFSRGQDDSGPMQWLIGSSNWRPFILPFHINNADGIRPIKLDFNIILPLRGTVYLGPLKLVQFEKGEFAGATSGSGLNSWWTERTNNAVGAITGTIVGFMGAAIGTLTGFGIARKVCLSLLGLMFVFGLASLALVLVILVCGTTAEIGGPLLTGILCIILPFALFRTIKQRYEQKELQKMQAMDIR
jgi:hypothetical protein